MAIALWILGVLLALIVLLCVTRVGVHAVFGETLLLDVKIGWFRIHILPQPHIFLINAHTKCRGCDDNAHPVGHKGVLIGNLFVGIHLAAKG